MNELISIIMPSYKTAQYISETIDSVRSQTYQNWELIIIDDCSPDNSNEIIEKYEDPRIRLVKNEKNLGAALSRNYGLREAKGRYIAFIDSDDTWHFDKLERQLKFMHDNNYSFTYTDYQISKNGILEDFVRIAPMKINKRRILDYCYCFTSTVMYDAEKVGLIQIEDLKKNNDYAMWIKALEKNDGYRFPMNLATYNKHDNSISSGSKLKLVKYHYILFHKGLGKNAVLSIILTLNNMLHGVIKKVFYKKKVKKYYSVVGI